MTDERLVIVPVPKKSLLEVLACLSPLYDDFPPVDELPLDAVEL